MSISLTITPTKFDTITWADVKSHMRFLEPLSAFDSDIFREPLHLTHIPDKRTLEDDEHLLIGESYILNTHMENTLRLLVSNNEATYTIEPIFLKDYGRNLTPESMQDYINRWQQTGYSYDLFSNAGRSELEPALFIVLASAIARSCNGYVALKEDGILTLGIGVYSPQEFIRAKWAHQLL